MRILDDGPAEAGAHEFTVELETGGEDDGARVRELWKSAADAGGHGVPHAIVRAEGGGIDPAALRAALERFNRAPDDGWRWNADALAAYLLHEFCGIAMLDYRHPDACGPAGHRRPPLPTT